MKKKGRGLSYEQKRDKMLKIFHDSRGVFNYEQVQKLSVKAGIAFPSVKQILLSLRADSLVQCQKIGAGVFYWSFPSKAMQIFDTKIAASNKQIEFYRAEATRLEEATRLAEHGREQTPEREELLELEDRLAGEVRELESEIAKYQRFDPERVGTIRRQNGELKRAINLATDNLEQIKKFIKRQQPGTKDSEIEQLYGIAADLEYLE